jgi:hypothetical protein
MDIPSVVVDPEFQDLIPVLSQEEKDGLEKSIKEEGCRDALVLWNGVLIDGHRRYEICQRNNIEFKIIPKTLPDRDAVKMWILCNQMARRNLPPNHIAYLRGKLYNLEKKKETGFEDREIGHVGPRIKTQDKLGIAFKVSGRTIRRDGEFAEKLDAMTAEERQEALGGKKKKTHIISSNPNNWPINQVTEEVIESVELLMLKKYWRLASSDDRSAFRAWTQFLTLQGDSNATTTNS